MSSLKRSQKLCPKCGEKNFIRQFKCKFCKYEFPKKDKTVIHNSSIEQFFFKMPNNINNDNNIINIDEDIEEEKEKNENIEKKEKKIEKKENTEYILNKNNIIENKNSKMNQFFKLLEKKGKINKDFLKIDNIEKYIKINYNKLENGQNDVNKEIKSIIFNTASVFPSPSFDIYSIDGINSYFISLLFREEKQINTLTNIIIYFNENNKKEINIYQNNSEEENPGLLYNQDIITQIISCNENYLLYSISYKNIVQVNLINSSKNLEILKITTKNLITKIDFNIVQEKSQIRIILSDSENNIFYYLYEANNFINSNIKLIGIYDFLFLYKITDIKFLNIKDLPENQNENFYFMTSSRDGLLYILNNLGDIIFQHKTNQTWITQCLYDSFHNILLFLTNFEDKIVGVKFNIAKDPIIKRIPKTDNTYCLQMTPFMDKIFYLDDQNNIYYLSTYIIEDMFRASKSKKKNDYKPKLVYKLEDKDKHMFLNKFKLIGNNKNITYDINNKNICLALLYNKEIKFVYI